MIETARIIGRMAKTLHPEAVNEAAAIDISAKKLREQIDLYTIINNTTPVDDIEFYFVLLEASRTLKESMLPVAEKQKEFEHEL